ncbi:MAG TPA: amidohydrolase family protein [Candidatus Dormibacteraeota bacterium]|nr:amidohydrolase family protein [Candidatus Dormibacteraeota bacterium]
MAHTPSGFRLVDCDGHILEPLDIWERYVPRKYVDAANRACSVYNDPEGGARAWINGELKAKGMQGGGTYGLSQEEGAKRRWLPGELADGGFFATSRVSDQMDPQDIEAVVIFGSVGNVLNGVRDGDLLAEMCRGYNNWVFDEYCSAHPDRLFPMAYLPWQNVAEARKELRRTAEKGFKGIKVPAKRRLVEKPVYDPVLDPVWADAQDAGMTLAVHPSTSFDDMPEMADVLTREEGALPAAGGILSPLNGMVMLTYFMYGGILDKYPGLKLAIIECNGGWMPLLLDRLDRQYKMDPRNYPGVKRLPSETFMQQCAVAFMAEETTLPAFAEKYQDQIIWGTDYPHLDAENVAEIRETLEPVPADIQVKILRNNAIRVFNLPLEPYGALTTASPAAAVAG